MPSRTCVADRAAELARETGPSAVFDHLEQATKYCSRIFQATDDADVADFCVLVDENDNQRYANDPQPRPGFFLCFTGLTGFSGLLLVLHMPA